MHYTSLILLSVLSLLGSPSSSAPLVGSEGAVTAYSDDGSGNLTSSGELGIDANFRTEFGSNQNPMPQVGTSQFIIITAADIATGDLSRLMQAQDYRNPLDRTMTISVRPASRDSQLEARHVLWGLFAVLTDLSREPRFTEGGVEIYMNNQHIGLIMVHRPRVGIYDSDILDLNKTLSSSAPVSAASTPLNSTLSTVVDSENFSTSLTVSHLEARAYYLSDVAITQADFFITAMNAIVGLTEQIPFRRGAQFVVENGMTRTAFTISPPDPPRTARPWNNRNDSIRITARLVNWVVLQDRYTEVACGAFRSNIQISYTEIRRWAPAT